MGEKAYKKKGGKGCRGEKANYHGDRKTSKAPEQGQHPQRKNARGVSMTQANHTKTSVDRHRVKRQTAPGRRKGKKQESEMKNLHRQEWRAIMGDLRTCLAHKRNPSRKGRERTE